MQIYLASVKGLVVEAEEGTRGDILYTVRRIRKVSSLEFH